MHARLPVAALAIATTVTACATAAPEIEHAPAARSALSAAERAPAVRSTALSAVERARARRFLAPIQRPEGPGWRLRTGLWVGEFDDVDKDGRADCWVSYGDDTSGLNVLVWPGCYGDSEAPVGRFRNPRHRMVVLAIPRELASWRWLVWLARRLREDSAISCVGDAIPRCASPGPEWEWVLAAGTRERADPGLRGIVAADWRAGQLGKLTGALIVPGPLADPWLLAHGDGTARPGAWILLDALYDRGVNPFACGGLQIAVEHGGILATDTHANRWKWLFRGLPDYGGVYVGPAIKCVAGVVVVQTSGWPNDFVVVDPITRDWLFLSSREYDGTDRLYDATTRGVLWRHNGPWLEPLPTMRALVRPRSVP